MNDKLQKILAAAILAPSGENCQPWKFAYDNHRVYVFNVPERDQSLYNFEQRGSMVAHGTLLENISIAASAVGSAVRMDLFPEPNNPELIARLEFSEAAVREESLYPEIQARATNRKPYQKAPLTPQQRSRLSASSAEVGGDAELMWLEERSAMEAVAAAASLNEYLVFENKRLKEFFYSHVRWNEEEDKRFKNGFYVKTLELGGPQKAMFGLLKYNFMGALGRLVGIPRKIAQENAKTYVASAAFGSIVIPTASREHYIAAGRLLQRIWLRATELGLSMQPLTGVLFFMQRVLRQAAMDFSPQQIEQIKNAYATIVTHFGVSDQTIALLFRIGKGDPPSGRCSRFSLDELIDNNLLNQIRTPKQM